MDVAMWLGLPNVNLNELRSFFGQEGKIQVIRNVTSL